MNIGCDCTISVKRDYELGPVSTFLKIELFAVLLSTVTTWQKSVDTDYDADFVFDEPSLRIDTSKSAYIEYLNYFVINHHPRPYLRIMQKTQ